MKSIPQLPGLLLLLCALAGCASAPLQPRFESDETLLAERDEWRGARDGLLVLRHHVEVKVDARRDAESRIVVHLVATRFSEDVPLALGFALPSKAKRTRTDVRLVSSAGALGTNDAVPEWDEVSGIDPNVKVVHASLPAPAPGGVTEAILEYTVPGTLTTDARFLDFADAPTAETLLRYDLADGVAGSFLTTLAGAKPIVTQKDGRTLIALLAQNLPKRPESGGLLARYVTKSVSTFDGVADVSTTWAAATSNYQRDLVDRSPSLEDGFACPLQATDIPSALAWVQARPERRNFFGDKWNEASPLPFAVSNNSLTAVTKVHLLAWLLREAKLPFTFAMARGPKFAPLEPSFPVPDAFEHPLLYVPTLGLFLDPACAKCAPGEVRETLAGGQAILVPPVGPSPLLSLPRPVSTP